ncbi:MAG: hypothetical protein M0Z43_08230 [Acidithiobacillus sp.]|nr:hypothetical protein [Acidithiobacillus sp.]
MSDKAERDPDSLLEVPYGGSFRAVVLAKATGESATNSTRSPVVWQKPMT